MHDFTGYCVLRMNTTEYNYNIFLKVIVLDVLSRIFATIAAVNQRYLHDFILYGDQDTEKLKSFITCNQLYYVTK